MLVLATLIVSIWFLGITFFLLKKEKKVAISAQCYCNMIVMHALTMHR